MDVCDMCLRDLTQIGKYYVKIQGNSIFDVDENYALCPKCSKKLKRYINFEKNKNKRRIGASGNE